MASLPATQTAVIQAPQAESSSSLPVGITHEALIPELPTPNHVLVRVLAVALNPTDYKMPKHFPMPASTIGCDFCGIVMAASFDETRDRVSLIEPGTRVCGAIYGYNPAQPHNGAFAEYVAADARLLLRVPQSWTDLQGAALGGIGWGTVGLVLWDPNALALEGRPEEPTEKKTPVLVYGGATATGTMACQILSLSGYVPITTASVGSTPLVTGYGAAANAPYKARDCAQQIKVAAANMAGGGVIKCAFDCITDPESAAVCFDVISRAGGRYACLEAFDESWRTRRAIKVETVLAYEMWGDSVHLGEEEKVYSRPANKSRLLATVAWAERVQDLLDRGLVKHHPLKQVEGEWEGVIEGLRMLQSGEVRGCKLVVQLAES